MHDTRELPIPPALTHHAQPETPASRWLVAAGAVAILSCMLIDSAPDQAQRPAQVHATAEQAQ